MSEKTNPKLDRLKKIEKLTKKIIKIIFISYAAFLSSIGIFFVIFIPPSDKLKEVFKNRIELFLLSIFLPIVIIFLLTIFSYNIRIQIEKIQDKINKETNFKKFISSKKIFSDEYLKLKAEFHQMQKEKVKYCISFFLIYLGPPILLILIHLVTQKFFGLRFVNDFLNNDNTQKYFFIIFVFYVLSMFAITFLYSVPGLKKIEEKIKKKTEHPFIRENYVIEENLKSILGLMILEKLEVSENNNANNEIIKFLIQECVQNHIFEYARNHISDPEKKYRKIFIEQTLYSYINMNRENESDPKSELNDSNKEFLQKIYSKYSDLNQDILSKIFCEFYEKKKLSDKNNEYDEKKIQKEFESILEKFVETELCSLLENNVIKGMSFSRILLFFNGEKNKIKKDPFFEKGLFCFRRNDYYDRLLDCFFPIDKNLFNQFELELKNFKIIKEENSLKIEVNSNDSKEKEFIINLNLNQDEEYKKSLLDLKINQIIHSEDFKDFLDYFFLEITPKKFEKKFSFSEFCSGFIDYVDRF